MSEKTIAVFTALAAPFPYADIDWRVGSTNADKSKGLALPYVTARAVFDRLDAVVGPLHWVDEVRELPRGGFVTRLCLTIDGEQIWHEDGADPSKVEPTKGGISDSLKRVAVRFGIGRYLYYLDPVWVPLRKGRITSPPPLPSWALPGGAGRPPEGYAGHIAHPDDTEPAPTPRRIKAGLPGPAKPNPEPDLDDDPIPGDEAVEVEADDVEAVRERVIARAQAEPEKRTKEWGDKGGPHEKSGHISEARGRRLWAIANEAARAAGVGDEERNQVVRDAVARVAEVEHVDQIHWKRYDAVIEAIQGAWS